MDDSVFERLVGLVGKEAVRTDDEALRATLSGWSPPIAFARRDSMGGGAPTSLEAVVSPANTDEIAAVVRWANETLTPLYIAGGASNVVEAGIPHAGLFGVAGVAVDLSRLDTLTWDEEALLVHVGAGLKLGVVEERLNAHEYTLGQFPLSLDRLTVGGAIAMDAVGLLSGRYGRPRDVTLGMTAVLPAGEIVHTASPPLGSAAFDLSRLLVGTEGVFGIITEATLAMRPQPEARAWAGFSFARRDDAIDAMRLIYRSDSRPAMARLMAEAAPPPDGARNGAAANARTQVLLAFEGDELAQTGPYQLAYAVCQQVGGEPLPSGFGEEWFEQRRHGTGFLAANARPGGVTDMLAVSAPWSAIKTVDNAIRAALAPLVDRHNIDIAHSSPHGAALVVTFEASVPLSSQAATLHDQAVSTVLSAVHENGGAVAFHLGTGRSRRRRFRAAEMGEGALAMLHTIKAALDPNNILQPGALP